MSELKTTVVTYEQYSDYEFIDPATWFITDALQNYIFFHTIKREVAQEKCDEMYGKGHYTVKTSRITKTKGKSESGNLSATGTASRRK